MAEATKLRIANGKIILRRGGKRITINANQSFAFTQKELDSLKEQNPDIVRTPVNEEESLVEVKAPPADEDGAEANVNAKANAKGGNAKGGAKAGGNSNDDPL